MCVWVCVWVIIIDVSLSKKKKRETICLNAAKQCIHACRRIAYTIGMKCITIKTMEKKNEEKKQLQTATPTKKYAPTLL